MQTIEADYVIVGAGSAGCVLAARLSEDPACQVVVLEAGGMDRYLWVHVPLGYGRTLTDPRVNWLYETEPEPGTHNRRMPWPRGKVLGGSSSINGLIYVRGQAEDYDHWRQLGNAGWAYEDVLSYFRRSERRIGPGEAAVRGRDGGLIVTDIARPNTLSEAYLQAALETGLPRNPDYNGRVQEGVAYYQTTSYRGRRCSAAVAFLKPAMRRANLRVITRAQAERVSFDGRRATGVVFSQAGQRLNARARREVILCGGAINSPQLLLLSGIGPAAAAQAMGIPVVADLPGVGRNLQDHYQARIAYRCRLPITVNDIMASPWKMARMAAQYALFRTGPLSVSAGEVAVFARTRPELASPDIQFHYIGFSVDRPTDGLHKHSGFTQNVYQLRPESRGALRLRSPDPLAPPAIQPNYLATELDRQTLLAGLKLGRRIAAQPVLAQYSAGEHLPGEQVQTDADLLDYVREYGATIYHPVGTCKMGRDGLAVVNDTLQVHGLEGLRVADGSIMPTLVSGNTNAACIMIGEKCADLLRGVALARAA